jgi:hypothetical protein
MVAIYLVVSFQTTVASDLKQVLNTTMKSAKKGNQISVENILNIQTLFMCCGVNGPSDYERNTTMASCYQDNNATNKIFEEGCFNALLYWIKERYIIITIILLFVILFKISSVFFAILVCARPRQMEAYDLF